MVYFLGGLVLFIHVRTSRPRVPSQQYHLVHNLPFVLYNIWESYFFVAKQPHFFGASKGNHKFSQNAVLVLSNYAKKCLYGTQKNMSICTQTYFLLLTLEVLAKGSRHLLDVVPDHACHAHAHLEAVGLSHISVTQASTCNCFRS